MTKPIDPQLLAGANCATGVPQPNQVALGGLLVEADNVLADLESRSVSDGQATALPFLGLARFELAATGIRPGHLLDALPESYEAGVSRVEHLLADALIQCRSLETCLQVLRTQSLLREHDRWRSMVAASPAMGPVTAVLPVSEAGE